MILGQRDGYSDVERAVRVLAERLPQPLWPLARLAYNYRWSWMVDGAAVFRDVHPAIWRRSECNPRYVIEAAPPHRLRQLAEDASYVQRLQVLEAGLRRDLDRPPGLDVITPDRPLAYLCSEFAVHCSLPLYGGGLGVLAGDFLKAASDLALPVVGVGLLYRQGYFHQRLDPSGWQHEYWTNSNFERLPVVRVSAPDGEPLTIDIAIRGRLVRIKIWRVDVGRVPLYLLDSDRDENHPIDRWITSRLYVGDRHTRLAQYAVLGIGGMRALEALGIRPSLVHLNEGHGALSSFERMRTLMTSGLTFDEAMATVRAHTVFTTHTPVAAGNEGYHESEIEPVFRGFIESLTLPRHSTFYDLGRLQPGNGDEPASITALALRTSRAANAVSRRHGEVARAMWHPLWPDRTVDQVPIGHVTNGVHTLTWMAAPMRALLDRHLGVDWPTRQSDPGLWEGLAAIPDAELWEVRCQQRRQLIDFVRERSILDRLSRGEDPSYVEGAAQTFDPDALTIGFARRMTTYKRFYLLSRNAERGLRLLSPGPTPIQIVVAGKAHPQDQEAKEALHNFFALKRAPLVGGKVAFLEDYDMHMAPRIVAGVDLWLNLPRPPLEASGTSGMKVTLNGGLNLSVLDGWWVEGYDAELGWAIESPQAEPVVQDDHDATALLDILEREVIPEFYERGSDDLPRRWVRRMKAAMRSLIPRFTAERMVREYAERMYAPSMTAQRK
jgi:starch phosphorylase